MVKQEDCGPLTTPLTKYLSFAHVKTEEEEEEIWGVAHPSTGALAFSLCCDLFIYNLP